MRVVDQRMAPGGQLDLGLRVAGRVVLGSLVAPKAQQTGLLDRDANGARDLLQGQGHRLRVVYGQRHADPQRRLLAQFGQGLATGAAIYRQQCQRGGLLRIPGQFDRAHGCAPRCGRQQAVACVGEKQCVDQLRFATRELGNKCQHPSLRSQLLAQRGRQRLGLGVEQSAVDQQRAEVLDASVKPASPSRERVQTGEKGARHGGLAN